MTTRLLARFDGKSLVPAEPVDLPTGLLLDVEVREHREPAAQSAKAILDAMKSLKPVSSAAAEELERAIAESQLPANHKGAFDED